MSGEGEQAKYDANKAQAIGRAVRTGQTQTVHIYEYFTANTIDVDIVEMRTGQVLEAIPENPSSSKSSTAKDKAKDLGYTPVQFVDRPEGEKGDFSSGVADIIFRTYE